MRRTIKCANASCDYHHRVHLSKAHNFQTFTTVLSAPTEMSYNQIQLQAIVSEPNSKATSIKNPNIIHLPLFVQRLYLGSETQSRTLCGSVRSRVTFIQAPATLIDICTHKRTITFYSWCLSFPPYLPSLFSGFSLLRFFFLHYPFLYLCTIIPPCCLLSSFSFQLLLSVR